MYGHMCMCSNLVTCMYPVISVLVNQWHNMHMCKYPVRSTAIKIIYVVVMKTIPCYFSIL